MKLLFLCLLLLPLPQLGHTTSIRRNRCELKLVADHAFYEVIGRRNYANAARYLINLIERVNGIFSQVDWGLDINGERLLNLGFIIKEIKIFDKAHDSPTHFNSNRGTYVNAMEVLKSFSSEEGSNDTCLSVLITGKPLEFEVLGLSNIGSPGKRGICATNQQNGTFTNTAIITVKRKSELMITRVVDLVLAHELGHSWGSLHDDVEDEECVPQNSRDGLYVMWESPNTGYDKNNYAFSPCSVQYVHRVLYALASRCFVEEKRALCGNGLLEEGEQCDSGAQFGKKDNCCMPNCKLMNGALCSPKHSECCSDQCVYLRNTPCQANNSDPCRAESVCSGTSDRCPEAKALPDGTECTDEGKCMSGECVSFCQTISPTLKPCLCENSITACQRCCRSAKTGICSPVEPVKWLPENSMCIHGLCVEKICEKKATDTGSFFRSFFDLKGPAHKKFFADYIVLFVVFISLLIWCPCGAVIVFKDQQKHNNLVEKRTAAQNNVQVLHERKRVTPQRSRSINEKLQRTSSSAGGQRIRPVHSTATLLLQKQQQLRQMNGSNGDEEEANEEKIRVEVRESSGAIVNMLEDSDRKGGGRRLIRRDGNRQQPKRVAPPEQAKFIDDAETEM